MVWWGLYLIALSAGAWWTVVSPLLMSLLLIMRSREDRLEWGISERGPAHGDYVARTSGFVPLPPRGSSR